jgi:hypothetical protein
MNGHFGQRREEKALNTYTSKRVFKTLGVHTLYFRAGISASLRVAAKTFMIGAGH